MLTKKVVVGDENGLHLRVASKVVAACRKHQADVQLCKDCQYANGCSVIDLLMLKAKQGTELELRVTGQDEAKALAAIAEVFDMGGGI